jgi:L-threonylcarbamoyladenylate synthase
LSVSVLSDGAETRERAARVVAAGGVLAFRTDTFYGLGADPFNRDALNRVNELKGRDGKPILVVVSDEEAVERFIARRSELFDAVVRHHWPGALTLVAEAKREVPSELTAGSNTIGLRLPDDEDVRAFVRAMGGALTATSANLAGHPPASTAEEVARSLPAGLDLIVDGGPSRGDKPSTVLALDGPEPRLIREGVVTRSELEETFRKFGLKI